MTQDTRKDPRAKVLTMTVRYKSATLDEFIEHHSYDVSRGGMFIKTPSPFPPGTLLKFEVKIAGEQRVMQGVGRVVWKREASEVSDARPAGMGVKFIKIDDDSRKTIDQLVAARGDSMSAFDQDGVAAKRVDPQATPGPAAAALRAQPNLNKPRKATMMGLGAMQAEPESPETAAAEAFFPPTNPGLEMPAPEDRTVMRQAAELLQDALREAGGSLEEVGTAKQGTDLTHTKSKSEPAKQATDLTHTKSKSEPAKQATDVAHTKSKSEPAKSEPAKSEPAKSEPAKSEPAKSEPAKSEPVAEGAKARSVKSEKSVIVQPRAGDEVTQPAARRSAVDPEGRKLEPPRPRVSDPPRASDRPRASEPPRARSAALQEAAGAAAEGGGGGRLLLALIGIAAAAGAVYFLTQPDSEPPEVPEPPSMVDQEPVLPPEPAPAAAPTPEPAAAPESSAAPLPSAPPLAEPVAPQTAAPSVPAVADPKQVVRPRVPRRTPQPSGGTVSDQTPPPGTQPKPSVPSVPEPAPAPKPAPVRKPAAKPDDNPY